MQDIQLSEEQQHFIDAAKSGKNVLVDACIGSGKTTAIQKLCEQLPLSKKVLYLTYNRLLKIDARDKIHRRNVTVTNYHGYAYMLLKRNGISSGIRDLIQNLLRSDIRFPLVDVLIIDEYQDIEQEFAEMLWKIKEANPLMQIVAVGDMQQKIYDKTTLNVSEFIDEFLGAHERLTFTLCFRLSSAHAAMLGRIWKKEIIGVNSNCIVEKMRAEQVVDFLSQQEPEDILCLGARTGDLADTLNILEEKYPDKFNKTTVYASITDDDGNRGVVPDNNCAIFTTFDSSKGLERRICVIFDFTESYWSVRVRKPQQSYEILRNIFCVAASRGKERIIFVTNGEALLSEETLSAKPEDVNQLDIVDISGMFDFKYIESVEACYRLLDVRTISADDLHSIKIRTRDALIDLSPCIGIYQEAVYFDGYNIDTELEFYFLTHPQDKGRYKAEEYKSLERKILFLTALETRQQRYITQVEKPLVKRVEKKDLIARLKKRLSSKEKVQVRGNIVFGTEGGKRAFTAMGQADVVKGDTVYELKFVSELSHVHVLQCACYMIALDLPRGILWNTKNNQSVEISIPDRKKFLDTVAYAVTKGALKRYYPIKE